MKRSQAFVWGNGVKVLTPHIDSLAEEGALFTNFNVVAPLCTPSRASLMTGLYPWFTGAWKNHSPMHAHAVTWAEILQKKAGYHTGYIGKWHLNGEAKPEFSNEERRFGFNEIKYMFNRGHWKFFDEIEEDGEMEAFEWDAIERFRGKEEKTYATDFLFKKAIKFMNRQIRKEQHFALMLSIPDPHGPNDVRAPYDTMYNDTIFKLPKTAVAAYHKKPALPAWSSIITNVSIANQTIASVENDEDWQTKQRQYFGMVKLIDDKVGEVMSFLKENKQDKNTIVVFTSDHGDMMGEHAKYNKGKPYLTSVGVPFIIRMPGHIRKGKIVKTAYSSPDFTPTILSLMGIDYSDIRLQGIDGSNELLSRKLITERSQVRFMTDSKQAKWAAAVDRQYKLVLSRDSTPFLFDMKRDPDELINYHGYSKYKNITNALHTELYVAMKQYNLPLVDAPTFYVNKPVCLDSNDQIPSLPHLVCSDLKNETFKTRCESGNVNSFCVDSCGLCCDDSSGSIWYAGNLITCNYVQSNILEGYCEDYYVSKFCPVTCMKCVPEPSLKPSNIPSIVPSPYPTTHPTQVPSSIPSKMPSELPTFLPTDSPSMKHSMKPSLIPTSSPSLVPSSMPSTIPTESMNPSYFPSDSPSDSHSPSDNPSLFPSFTPSAVPTESISPSDFASDYPSNNPSDYPSNYPSSYPSYKPSSNPSIIPSMIPSFSPSQKTSANPSFLPSNQPTSNLVDVQDMISAGSATDDQVKIQTVWLVILLINIPMVALAIYYGRKYLMHRKKNYANEMANRPSLPAASPKSENNATRSQMLFHLLLQTKLCRAFLYDDKRDTETTMFNPETNHGVI